MFSIEISPTDPACPQQKASNGRGFHKRCFPEADLSKSAIANETSFSNFSIREYVLSSRGKDIKANWPFSPKTLQLCLNYGVKDLLPPFQALPTFRTQSIDEYMIENAKPDNRSISSFNGEPAQLDHHVMINSSKFAKSNSNSCRFDRGNDLLPTTNLSPSEIESIPRFCSSNSSLEFDKLLETPSAAEAAEPLLSLKSERTAKQLVKKCRFSVKYEVQVNQASGEDIVSNCITKSETMAAKTCPVCRIFSSSSNTTLNAHIDQCLSVESTPKRSLDSKSTKHRFKPRKTKMLVDIYATASRCTLEDLDRRNGTTWAIVSRLPTSDIEKSDMHYEDGVYIDSKGTKLRILSAFNISSSKVRESLRSTRLKKKSEGQKFRSSKRKKYHAPKYKKFLKVAAQRKNISPLKDLATQIDKAHDRYNGAEEGCKMDKHESKLRKPRDSGCLSPWICSKRTGVQKRPRATKVSKILNVNGI